MAYIWSIKKAGEARPAHYLQLFPRGTSYPVGEKQAGEIMKRCDCERADPSEYSTEGLPEGSEAVLLKVRGEEPYLWEEPLPSGEFRYALQLARDGPKVGIDPGLAYAVKNTNRAVLADPKEFGLGPASPTKAFRITPRELSCLGREGDKRCFFKA